MVSLAAIALLSAVPVEPAAVAITPPRIRAVLQGGSTVAIDGVLDEPQWQTAAVVTGLTQAQPIEDGPPVGRAEFRVFYDRDALYLAARIYQPPGILRAHVSPRDDLGSDDSFRFYLMPVLDSDVAYVLRVNPLGVQRDVLVSGPEIAFPSWDIPWESAGKPHADGYSVEAKIPFSSLRFSRSPVQDWGINFGVVTGSTSQLDLWPPMSRARGNELAQLGTLEGMKDLDPSTNLEIIPTLVGRHGGQEPTGGGAFHWRDPAYFETRRPGTVDAGLDVHYAVTPAITASLTINPDFSQAEADADQLSYNNRYPILLQEKRPFFLEGHNVFETPVSMLYSRAINDPVAGLKLAGLQGGWTVGVLSVLDQDPPASRIRFDPSRQAVPTTGFESLEGKDAVTTVARLAYGDSLAGVGLFVADKQALSRGGDRLGRNDVVSVDGRANLGKVYFLSAQGGLSSTDWSGGDALAGGFYLVNLRRETRSLLLEGETAYFGSDFRAEATDLSRVGYFPSRANVAYKFEIDTPLLQYVQPQLLANANVDDRSHDVVDWTVRPTMNLAMGGATTVSLQYAHGEEGYNAKAFRVRRGTVTVGSSPASWLDAALEVGAGTRINYDPADDFLGRNVDTTARLTFRPSRRALVALSYVKSLLWRAAGAAPQADVDLVLVKLQYSLDRAWSLRVISQYNTFAESWQSSALLAWVPSPGRAFYLGYQDSEITAPRSTAPIERSFFLKFSYAFRALGGRPSTPRTGASGAVG